MIGWLVNDQLTGISGTRTLWHDLLDWLPGLQDRTGGYTPFARLAAAIDDAPDPDPHYIIRNATYFPPLRRSASVPTIALLQDVAVGTGRQVQQAVADSVAVVVYNSTYTRSRYLEFPEGTIIPLGVNFELFRPLEDRERLRLKHGILPHSVLFVGSGNAIKGFDRLQKLVEATPSHFCVVTKDGSGIAHPRVRNFSRVGHEHLVEIINACSLGLCLSREETQHLAGIEMGACGLPLLTTPVGAYFERPLGIWGRVLHENDDVLGLLKRLEHEPHDAWRIRSYWEREFSQTVCRDRWRHLVHEVTQ